MFDYKRNRNKDLKYKEACLKADGQITVMAALVFTLVLSLVIICIKSARLSAAYTNIKHACRLASDAVFAGYNNEVLDEFDIMVLKKGDVLNEKLSKYISDNSNSRLITASFDTYNMMADDAGIYMKDQAVSYMRYGVLSEVVSGFMSSEEQVKKADKVNEITDSIAACEEQLCSLDENILELIELVEGLETNQDGFVVKNNKPVAVKEYFAKSVIHGELTMNKAAINNQTVYDAVSGYGSFYKDVDEYIDAIIYVFDEIEELEDAEGYLESYNDTYRNNYDEIKTICESVKDKTQKALDVISRFDENREKAGDTIQDCRKKLDDSREIIGDELYDGLDEDITVMENENASNKRKMCDIDKIRQGLEKNIIRLNSALKYIKWMDVGLSDKNVGNLRNYVQNLKISLDGMDNSTLRFDYSGIDFSSDSTGLGAIKKLYSTLTDGIVGLVLEEDSISDKTISYTDLASSLSGEYEGKDSIVEETMDTLLFDEYILTHFAGYTDYSKDSDSGKKLDYMVEYILEGNESDRENLKNSMVKISLIREGMNLAYLLTDKEKKSQAYALAATLLGFTGNTAIIKAGQYLVLTVWAYGEAIMDLKKIYSGKRCEFIKSKDNWQLSLSNLIAMRFSLNEDNDTDKSGLSYKDYLRMLLILEGKAKKNYRTMGAIEIRMIEKGKEDFRMRDYIAKASGRAVFNCGEYIGYYSLNISGSYL